MAQPEVMKPMERRVSRSVKTEHPQYTVTKEGIYLFIVHVRPQPQSKNATYRARITVEMKNDNGYLSAADSPLLPVSTCPIFLYCSLFKYRYYRSKSCELEL